MAAGSPPRTTAAGMLGYRQSVRAPLRSFVALPVHEKGALVDLLQPIPTFRVPSTRPPRDHLRQCDEWATIPRPASQDWEVVEGR